MRYAELSFLTLLVLYHAFLLLPRHRRPFAANYLVFVAGMALAWNLGLEGLRWQTGPAVALLLIDLVILFPTFGSLRGAFPTPGFLSALTSSLRLVIAFVTLLVSISSTLLSIAFPLPRVELTGGLPPSQRIVQFPASGDQPALQLTVWYPASGQLKPQPRPAAQAEAWQRVRAQGGLPVFWQSYLEHLPTNAITGGKLASPKTKYPVVYAAVPRGQDPADFAYLFEDLASRGFVVAAGTPLPTALPPQPEGTAWSELLRPWDTPTLWLEPELSLKAGAPEMNTVGLAQRALRQLASEPGDSFFEAIDWSRQGLWAWGEGAGLSAADSKALGIRGTVRAGAQPTTSAGPELWISPALSTALGQGRWVLTVPGLKRADLSDSAYLKPYLAFFGLKTQADAGFHGAIRQYQAAYFQYLFWNTSETSFGQTVPAIPGLTLSGR